MLSAKRRQDLSVILLWIVVVLLFVGAVVPWIHYGPHSFDTTDFSTGLNWQADQPPEVVVMAMPAVALVLAVIASSRPEIRVWVVLSSVIFAVVFARLLQQQSPIGLPWHLTAAVRPSGGYWVVAVALVMLAVAVLLSLSSAAVRVERPSQTASAAAVDGPERLPAPDPEDRAWPGSG